ncbi:MAG: VOC family protein [Oscillospiraceae bacterium]|jgi:catechol 2,3-dioxygenase-like lactoylglutathione lyase family enzyme|nr:VOC family protein [Oscillospiraceae bacterium]
MSEEVIHREMKGLADMTYKAHHIGITVRDIYASERFYDVLMSALGFDIAKKYKGHLDFADMDVVEYVGEDFDFSINSPKSDFKNEIVNSRKPGAVQHFAFNADSRDAVDAVFDRIKDLGVNILHDEARVYTKLGLNYYALFFEDPDGIRFEVFHNGL